MAINLICKACKSNANVRSRKCKKCGESLTGCMYRVIVRSHDGKRVTKSVDNITTARKLEAKYKAEAQQRKLFGNQDNPLIDRIGERFLEWARTHKKSWRDDEERWRNHVLPHLKGRRMDAVTPYEVQRLPEVMMSKRVYAPATIKQVLVLVKRVFNWAKQMGLYAGENPVAGVRMPVINNERTEYLSTEEIRKLLSFLDQWKNRAAAITIKFAFFTGFRRGEVFGLRWDNVSMERGCVRLVDTKGGKDCVLPLNSGAMDALRESSKLFGPSFSPYAFPGKSGKERKDIRTAWDRAKLAAGIAPDFRFHGLRHNFASHLASSGQVSMLALQRLLTHKSPQMTQRYAHLLDEELRRSVELMEQV